MQREVLIPEADLSTEELFERVLRDLRFDDDDHLSALVALHERPTRKVVDRCVALCSSDDPYERAVGLQILRELDHPYTDGERRWASLEPMVIALAATDPSPEVIKRAISCLGHQSESSEATATVLTHAEHPDWRVRFAVAAGLPHMASEVSPIQPIVDVLLRLAEDPEAHVRSYAIMGLVDDLDQTNAIEPTLRAHLSDPDEQIRRFCREALEANDA